MTGPANKYFELLSGFHGPDVVLPFVDVCVRCPRLRVDDGIMCFTESQGAEDYGTVST